MFITLTTEVLNTISALKVQPTLIQSLTVFAFSLQGRLILIFQFSILDFK